MSSTLDLNDVQGDILVGLPKRVQQYYIFQIESDVTGFRKALSHLIPLITTTTQAMQHRDAIAAHKKTAQEHGRTPELLPLVGVNIAFAHTGLHKMGINDSIRDDFFTNGQKADARSLNDPGQRTGIVSWEPSWDAAFLNPVDGVVLIAGDSEETVAATRRQVERIFNVGGFNATIREVITLNGKVRPGHQRGHEHFGFKDCISQPAVEGVNTNPYPGQGSCPQGVVLCARDGDNTAVFRPEWAKDGSFMVLRWLWQSVPEFNRFLDFHPIDSTDLSAREGSEFLGARLIGRWKSGAPVASDAVGIHDNPELAADPLRNNLFDYKGDDQGRGFDLDGLIPNQLPPHRIIRRGIPFGPELSQAEISSGTTQQARGLIFVCYQSNISDGFRTIQTAWANNPKFPPKGLLPLLANPGFDPIIGQAGDGGPRTIEGVDPTLDPRTELQLPTQFVTPKGGEYFFSPSLPALHSRFALPA